MKDKRTITARRIEILMRKNDIKKQTDLQKRLNSYFNTEKFNTTRINRWLKKEIDSEGDNYQLEDMLCLCEFFGCSLDYLFGFSDSDTPNAKVDYSDIGLVDESIGVLTDICRDEHDYYLKNAINLIITSPYFRDFLIDFINLQLFDTDNELYSDIYKKHYDLVLHGRPVLADDRKRIYENRCIDSLKKLSENTLLTYQLSKKHMNSYKNELQELKNKVDKNDPEFCFINSRYIYHKEHIKNYESKSKNNKENLDNWISFIRQQEEDKKWEDEHPGEIEEMYKSIYEDYIKEGSDNGKK